MDYIIINGELYHHGVKGMKWGVRKVDKLRNKAKQYDKYSKEYAKEGSRRTGSDGARQTDREMKWMNQLADQNKKKSQAYTAKADKLEAKIKAKQEKKELNSDAKQFLKTRSEFTSSLAKSVSRNTTHQDLDANTQKLVKVATFVQEKQRKKGQDYVNKMMDRANLIQKRRNTAGVLGFFASATAATVGYAYLQSKFDV